MPEDKCKYCGQECGATCEDGMVHMDMLEAFEDQAVLDIKAMTLEEKRAHLATILRGLPIDVTLIASIDRFCACLEEHAAYKGEGHKDWF